MKFGIIYANTMRFADRDGLVELAQGAEAAGFESVWTVEHAVFPDDYTSEYPYDPSGKMIMAADTNLPDRLIWLAWVAACTTRLRIGTGILILPQRNPLVLAKTLSTLDALSAGRVELGVGVGWLREEFAALGVPFDDRAARTEEHIAVLRALWDGDHAEHHGERFDFAGVSVNPKPARGRVPIHIGGHSVAAARRAGRIGDGFFPAKGNLRELIDIMRQTAADAGRDPDAIEVTSGSVEVFGSDPVGAVQELRDQGVDRVVVPAFLHLKDPATSLAAFGENVIGPSQR